MPDHLPSGTITFLFTDIEGSTPLWEREPKQMRMALERHHAILHESIAAHRGHVYKIIGDAFQAAFEVSSQAILAALTAQRALAAEVWPTSTPLRVRMGLHVGHAKAQGEDYTTTHTLNRVARIMSAAHGGQILLSEAVVELIRDDLPEAVSLRDMGHHHLKGLTQLEHLFQVVVPDLSANFPPLNTLNVAANNLPTQLTTFIGRETEVAEVKRLLSGSRLTTLTGSGGCGKTRLSIQVASEMQTGYPNGVWLVELAPVADPALVPLTVVAVLGLMDDGHRPALEILTDFIHVKTLLLVLDNCEHVIDACAQLSEALLRACPKLGILASSREALGIAGESSYRVPSLAVPEPGQLPPLETLARLGAVRLFVERAALARPGFALTAQNAPAIAQICQRLDGIPLAIELAAARVRALSAEEINARLDDRFRLLTGGSRTALPRQQTLRALIDWSYSLLSEPERLLFKRLAVFVGGWALAAAEKVCSDNGLDPATVLDTLSRLVDKSLVVAEEAAGETRYSRLETIRQYSREKFAETDEVAVVRDRHLAYYVQFSEMAEEHVQGREAILWSRRLEAEQDNLRAALEWGLARNPDSALRIVGALQFYWHTGGYSAEGSRWTQQALERVEATAPPEGTSAPERRSAKAKALRGLAWLYVAQADNENARRWAEQSVALYRQGVSWDTRGLSYALTILAQAQFFLGERDEADASLKEAVGLSRVDNDVVGEVGAMGILVRVRAVMFGDLESARGYAEEGIRLAREAGLGNFASMMSYNLGLLAAYRLEAEEARLRFGEAIAGFGDYRAHFAILLAKSDLAHLERNVGNYPRALELYRETITAFRDVGQRGAVAHQLECFAYIAIAQNQFDRGVRLLGAAEAWRERGGTSMTPEELVSYQKQMEAAGERMDSELFSKTWAEGRALTMEQAIQYATEGDSILRA
ncbi:MAG: adenylate/guanylate cyclase domain-containing protein [Anaerolineales bacterium]